MSALDHSGTVVVHMQLHHYQTLHVFQNIQQAASTFYTVFKGFECRAFLQIQVCSMHEPCTKRHELMIETPAQVSQARLSHSQGSNKTTPLGVDSVGKTEHRQ